MPVEVGDHAVCAKNGVKGKVVKQYYPTGCAQQTMVVTDDGRHYHAPTWMWEKVERRVEDENTRS